MKLLTSIATASSVIGTLIFTAPAFAAYTYIVDDGTVMLANDGHDIFIACSKGICNYMTSKEVSQEGGFAYHDMGFPNKKGEEGGYYLREAKMDAIEYRRAMTIFNNKLRNKVSSAEMNKLFP